MWHMRKAGRALALSIIVTALLVGAGIWSCASKSSGGSASLSDGRGYRTISEDQIGSLPPEQQKMFSDPGWNQPYVSPAADSTTEAPSYEELMAETQQAMKEGMAGKAGKGKAAGQPAKPAANGVIDQALAKAGVDTAKLNSWLIPAAYAQDHGIDERYLVRSGECQLEVEDYKSALGKLKQIAIANGGSVTASESSRLSDDTLEGWVTLRVPGAAFGTTWDGVLEVGKVLSEKTGAEDVSQQYVGYVSQLKSMVAEQAVLQKMLDEALAVQRARGLGEGYKMLLETQQRLFEVSGQIQNTEDSLNALTDRITRSTITAHLKETRKLPAQAATVTEEFDWGLGATAATAYKALLVKLRGISQSFIFFVITCWTWLIPWALIIWLGVWAYRRWLKPHLKRTYGQPTPGASGAQ